MNESNQEPELLVEKSRVFPLVWLIPLVALGIGIWLAYKTLSEEGPTVTITFQEASGLEAGKTKVKYKDVEVGLVETVHLNEDLTQVIVTAKLEKHMQDHLREGTKFWVVKPQLGLGGVSGLDTLIAGNYIGVEFGQGKAARKFTGLEHAPKISADTPGRHFTLLADSAGSLTDGTPLYFRDIKIGWVVDVDLASDHNNVLVDVFVSAPFDRLVHNNSRFWLANGIDLSMNADGVKLKVGSLLSLLGGGITMDTPYLNAPDAKPSEAGARFTLHQDFASVAEGLHLDKKPFVLYFDDSVRGLSAGAPVEIRGIRIGTVTDVKFQLDLNERKVRIPVFIEIDPDRLFSEDEAKQWKQKFHNELAAGRRPIFETLVAQGLRARLKSGSLLTGQLYVDLDFYPEAEPKSLVYGGAFPELPTLPSITMELQNSVSEILAKLKQLPLDKIGVELLGTVQGANRLANSADLKNALHSMDAALKDVHQLSQTADRELVKLSSSLEKSLSTTTKILEQIEPGSPIVVDVSHALEELAATARSLRALTDYLERHPEALLHGKGGVKK